MRAILLKRRFLVAIAILLLLFGTLVVSAAFRIQQLPSLLTIFVTFRYLTRNGDYSYAGQALILLEMTTKDETADNVTLVPPAYSNRTTNAYWRLQIVLNDSAITVAPWEHDIEPSNLTAGEFSGTVSKSFPGLNGNFTVWIIVWSVYQGSSTMNWWMSEELRIY
jgi:hypothetical protein